MLLDSAVWSKSGLNGSTVHVTFVDWLPFLFSSLGMLVINSVEKSRLSADSFSYSGPGGGGGGGVAWKARVVLFLGFAALAGGMAGGVTVFVLKFAVPGVPWPALNMGVENVVANALVGLRCVSSSLFFICLSSLAPPMPPYSFVGKAKLLTPGFVLARWCFGSARTWRTSIPTTSPCDRDAPAGRRVGSSWSQRG